MADFWDFVAKKDGRRRLTRKLYTASGTSAAWNVGYPADIARWLINNTPYWRWQGDGYPAATIPMGPSVAEGVAEMERLLADPVQGIGGQDGIDEWAMIGYSQGGIVVSLVYNRMKAGISPVSWALPRLKMVVTYGNPCREKGVANGNKYAGWPLPPANDRGIAPADQRLVDTPDWWYDFAHPHDIYTDTPDGDGKGNLDYLVGQDMTMIYQMVQDGKHFVMGPDSLLSQFGHLFVSPLKEIPAALIAVMHGIGFVSTKPWPTYPHTSYDIGPGIQLLNDLGAKVAIPV